jgi:tetratricopeptide (TPR) repeat protein
MDRRALTVRIAVCILMLSALLASGLTGSRAFTFSSAAASLDQAARSQKKDPAQGQSRDKSRNLVHKGTETSQPVLGLNEGGPQSYAVIIGISAYKNLPVKSQLQFADQDATAIKDFLVGPSGGFRPENVDLLINDQAGRTPILRALEKLQNTASNRDLAFIFFAGHGIVKGPQGFVLAYDSDPEDLLLTAVDMDIFNSVIRNLRARSVVIFTDACHSGTIGDVTSQTGAAESVTNLTAKSFADTSSRPDQTSFIFSAASPTQSSWELGPLKHGLFTYHVIEGLGGKADRSGNGLVTADELYDYVVTNVRRDAEQQGHSQVPEFNARYDRSIPLAYLNDAGLKLYKEWFDSDPFTTRYSALFDEALNHNYLIKPEQESAWDYYNQIKLNALRTPPELIKKMREQLLAKLTSSSQTVIDQSPSDPLIWEEAAAFLGRAHELSLEKNLRARQAFCTAMSARHSNEYGRAERECDIALSTIKDSNLKEPPLCFKIAQLYMSLKKLDKARDSYKLAIESEFRVDWVCEYAEVLKQLNDLPEADSQLRLARTKDPKNHRVLKLLAEVLVLEDRAEQFGEAVEIAREARQIKPNDVDIEEVFGWALLKAGKPAEALDPLRKVAQLRLADERLRDAALLRLGQAYANSGDLDRSASALREAERQGSKLPEIYDEMSQVLEQQGDLDGAIAAAGKAVEFVQSTGKEKAKRVRRVAEYLERTGRIEQAALMFADAARLWADVKVAKTLTAHASVLSYRVQRFQDAPPTRKRPAPTRRTMRGNDLLIIPAGREPLKRLTGVAIEPGAEAQALAVIFDTCLRDPAFKARLVRFYEKYHDLVGRLQGEGFGTATGSLTLPAPGKPHTPAANEALDFFEVEDKNGKRTVKKKEFESRKFVLEALGGDPERLEQGEETTIKFNNNDEWSVPLGVDRWVGYVKEMVKAGPQDHLREFLKDDTAMRFFVGLAGLPDNAIEGFADKVISREDWKEISRAVYFVTPFLRFSPDGHLVIPGQRGGELNWQRLLKADSGDNAFKSLFKKDKAEALYLFAALSNAGDVGDFIARSPLLDDFYRVLKDSSLPDAREPFDLIDLLSFFRVEDEKLRLAPAVELWLAGERPIADRKDSDRRDSDRKGADRKAADRITGDPIASVIRQIEKTKIGRTIPVVRFIAALDHISRERPDWVADIKWVDLIVTQISAGRESQLELALDLQMSPEQLEMYLSRIARVDGISTPAVKQTTAYVYQSVLELLRIAERNGVVSRARINETMNLLLELDPGSERFALDMLALLRTGLLDAASPVSGQEFEKRLIDIMSQVPGYLLQKPPASGDKSNGAQFFKFEASKPTHERIAESLEMMRHTRLRAVIDATGALDTLEKSPSDTAAIERLRSALGEFIEPEPQPLPKKSKSKEPVVRPPTMKEIAEQLTAPVTPGSLENLRSQITPFVSQALRGAVYAVMCNPDRRQDPSYAALVLNHDMLGDVWGGAELDGSKKSVRGGLARLGYALAKLDASPVEPAAMAVGTRVAPLPGSPADQKGTSVRSSGPSVAAPFTATTLNSFQLVNNRLLTKRAAEFVSRSIDLGEDVLGLYLLGDQNARAIVEQLEQLTPRRAQALRANLDGSEIKKALTSLSLSELYSIGQQYFTMRLGAEPLSSLVIEPGALGAMANTVAGAVQPGSSDKAIPEALRQEIRQFGMTMVSRTGLMRLDLRELETYEQSGTVGEIGRLIERLQDFKLAVARACYRRGYSPALAFSPTLVRAALEQSLGEMGKGTGQAPPDRDWQNLLKAIQAFDEAKLNVVLEKLAASSYARPVEVAKWNDEVGRPH